MPIAPTLILGLGGTGSKIVQNVAEKVRESGSTQSERIAFAVFDTDINDLGRIRRDHPEIFTVQTSTRNTVGEYLNINTNARDNWFPVNQMLNRKTLTEGAAQVRAISRLAFDTTLKGGNLDALHKAIEQLFRIDKDQEEQALRVIITSSLAGGTGSGLILSVAMYLADYLSAKYPKAKAITRGFFVQPDVFYKVITATEERQNLQVNAYAAVRELDAFLMKGDDTLPPEYRDLAFEFPRVGADGVEIINAMPYDFCFLFDANNTKGGMLDSFATYLDHAATCIYTQSIGPMSKKSNSREDNVLREVIKNDGRNRYAGAGASRLVYPWMHVRDVVSLRWAELAISGQWLKFDEQFKQRLEGAAKQREKGFAPRDLDLATEYINAVEGAAAAKDPFARAIKAQTILFDEDGFPTDGTRWEEYLDGLKKYVETNSVMMGDDAQRRTAASLTAALADTAQADDYIAAFTELRRYHDIVARNTEEAAGILSYSLFHSDDTSVTKTGHTHQLESYLRDKNTGAFVHPVSARYFIYQTLASLKAERQRVQYELDSVTQFFDGFEKNAFDDPGTEEIETAESLYTRKPTWKERLRGKPGPALMELQEKYLAYLKRVDSLRSLAVYDDVLGEAITYVTGIGEAFRTFFTRLDSNIKRLKSSIEIQRTKYDDLKGSTTRYVLASSHSLDSVYASMPYTGGVVNVDSDLSEAIYEKVRGYHMLADEKDDTYFEDLYQSTVLGYFKKKVMESYGPQIKIDVIEALEREFRTVKKNFEEAKVHHYVVDEIEKAKGLAAPFLEQPLGEERHPIQACAYNPALEGDSDPKRKSLISELLGNYGGERDDEISPQEILFYNAIYGIRARDLPKYSPARTNATATRDAGEYFSSYYQLVSGIQPSVDETKVITPHIDRRWHWVSKLPDLDEGYQRAQVRGIHDALLLGLLYKRIVWNKVHGENRVYQYAQDRGLPRDFVVSNGTPCDHFHEVVDALTINPVAVTDITASVDAFARRRREEAVTHSFAGTDFGKALAEGIFLPELGAKVVPALGTAALTIFDVAAFYAMTVPKELYFAEKVYSLVVDFLDRIREEVDAVEDEKDALPALESVLLSQLGRFEKNIPAYVAAGGDQFRRKLGPVLLPLAEMFETLGFLDRSTKMREAVDELLGA